MFKTFKNIMAAWAISYCLISPAYPDTAKLQFYISSKPAGVFTLDQLKTELKVHEITLSDPHYAKVKRFSAFRVQDVLQLAYGEQWKKPVYTDVTFTALDGYKAIGKLALLKQKGGYIAFDDLDIDGWELISKKQVVAGPFYLVWKGAEQTTARGYPWPWQLASINLVRFEDQYPAVYPQGVAIESTEYRGYQIFKHRCFRCHAMNQQGGVIGPDLNAPKSIVEYRSRKMIKAFIKQPSLFRYSHMPDHLDLSNQDLDALLDYFWLKSKQK